jgi:hypothetical protein
MTDIDIVRDSDDDDYRHTSPIGMPGRPAARRRSTWAWLIPVLLVIVAIAALWMGTRDNSRSDQETIGTTGSSVGSGADTGNTTPDRR